MKSFLVLVFLVTSVNGDKADMNIPAGDDQFKVADAGFALQLPPDFFGPGSNPFDGTIICGGGGDGSADTTIRRLEDMNLPPPPSEDTIPIEIIELNLISCQPIIVNNNDGTQQLWNVQVGLSPTAPPPGQMTIRRTHENGGTFDSQLFVQPRFIFTHINDPQDEREEFQRKMVDFDKTKEQGDAISSPLKSLNVPWQTCPSPDSEFIFNFCPEIIQFFSDDSWLNLEPIMPVLPDEDNCLFPAATINPIQYDINGDGMVDSRDVSALQLLTGTLTGLDSPEKEFTSGEPARADLNSDGMIDEKDTELLESLLKSTDINSDGLVDERDIETLESVLKSFVDINGDGVINEQDLQRIKEICPDPDNDGVIDDIDNCPSIPNPDQSDSDTDGLGDACDNCPNDPDNDVDQDDICGDVDNCPLVPSPDQSDFDKDGIGDVCDWDDDNDRLLDTIDRCPLENPQGLDANIDGCLDRIEDLPDNLEDMDIQAGVKNSLLAKVNNAASLLTGGRINAGMNILGAFINQVEAQFGKKISPQDATVLADFAQNIIRVNEGDGVKRKCSGSYYDNNLGKSGPYSGGCEHSGEIYSGAHFDAACSNALNESVYECQSYCSELENCQAECEKTYESDRVCQPLTMSTYYGPYGKEVRIYDHEDLCRIGLKCTCVPIR